MPFSHSEGHNDDSSFQGDANCTECLYTPHESDLSIENPGDNWFWRRNALVRLANLTATPCKTLALELRPTLPIGNGTFDAVVLQEDLVYGQVVLRYSLEVQAANSTWLTVTRPTGPGFESNKITGGLTIGQKLIDRFAPLPVCRGCWRARRGLHKMVPPDGY